MFSVGKQDVNYQSGYDQSTKGVLLFLLSKILRIVHSLHS